MRIALTTAEAALSGLRQFFHTVGNFPRDRIKIMKTAMFALCFLCATACFGQVASSISSTAQPTTVPDHPQHASQHAMAQESSLLDSNPYSYSQGERPLAEFVSAPARETPLGDIARAYKKEHPATAKAVKALEQ
jgi:hypothetical protein